MLAKLKAIASFFILIGIILLLPGVGESFNLYNVPYILIIVGVVFLVISSMVTNNEKSPLCRIGLHKYERLERDSEIPAMFLYECTRCGKQKKAASII